MNESEVIRVYEIALEKWGKAAQIAKTVEECAELIVAIAKNENVDDILEEMADVEIMLEQMKLIFNYDFRLTSPHSKFHAIKEKKLLRLRRRLEA